MLIDCPGCGASYHITKAALGANGRRVACPRCETIWLAAPSLPQTTGFIKAVPQFLPEDKPVASQAGYVRAIAASPPAPLRPRELGFTSKFMGATAALVLAMGLIASRDAVARIWPPAGRLYADIGIPAHQYSLTIRDLHTVLTQMNGEAYLGVEGVVVNRRGETAAVPPIQLAVLDAAGHELYTWQISAGRHRLAAGGALPFRARLAAPPADGRDVVAHFVADEVVADR